MNGILGTQNVIGLFGQVEGGASTRARDYQGVEVPLPLALVLKSTRQITKHQNILGGGGEFREV